jgi:hypothetical protein
VLLFDPVVHRQHPEVGQSASLFAQFFEKITQIKYTVYYGSRSRRNDPKTRYEFNDALVWHVIASAGKHRTCTFIMQSTSKLEIELEKVFMNILG